MALKKLTSASTLFWDLPPAAPSRRFTWTPGDFTRYEVILLMERDTNRPTDMIIILPGDPMRSIIMVPVGGWTPRTFLATYGEEFAGWWPAIRPLLAAMDWLHETVHHSYEYNPHDAVEIGRCLTGGSE